MSRSEGVVGRNILKSHLEVFNKPTQAMCDIICDAAISLHQKITEAFVKTAIKFHYEWNLREMSAVFQGLCRAFPAKFTNSLIISRLWLCESNRVYKDRLAGES